MNQDYQKNNQNSGNDAAYAVLAIALIGAAIWYKKSEQIQYWLYQNMMEVVFFAFCGIGALVLYVIYRMKKKNQREFDRARALESVRPSAAPRNYYERRNR